jgi:hypothetical protein
MAVAVARADADQRVLRPQRREQALGDRLVAAVVADLEHVDVAERPGVDERLEHARLGVPRQQLGEPAVAHEEHDARLVDRGRLHGLGRPQDVGGEPAAAKPHFRDDLAHSAGPTDRVDLRERRARRRARTRREHHERHADESR